MVLFFLSFDIFCTASSREISFIITHQLFPITLKETQTVLQKNRIAQKDDSVEKSIITILSLLLAHCIQLRIQKFHNDKEKKPTEDNTLQLFGDSGDEFEVEHSPLGLPQWWPSLLQMQNPRLRAFRRSCPR